MPGTPIGNPGYDSAGYLLPKLLLRDPEAPHSLKPVISIYRKETHS